MCEERSNDTSTHNLPTANASVHFLLVAIVFRSMLDPTKTRSATITSVTPVEVIEIPREDYERFVSASASTKTDLQFVRNSRMLKNAKSLIRLQKNLKSHDIGQGQAVFKEGDLGSSMFTVCENGGTFKVTVDGTDVGELREGDMFGETALLLKRPRSSTVTCDSPTCKILEMRGDDFLQLISDSPEWVEKSFRDLSRRREFKKALLLR